MLAAIDLMTRFPRIFLIISLLLFTSAMPSKDGLTDDVLKYTNQYRKAKGLTPLEMREDLNQIARKHSEDMASGRRKFGHSNNLAFFFPRTDQY